MSRAAAENIIPSETSVAELLAETMPKLAGRLHAGALQVPVQNGSLVDITLWLERPATAEAINAAVQQAARGPLARTLEYLVDPIVSSDVAQSTYSSSFDSLATMMLGDRMAKVIAWFDNSWGYSHRVVDLLATMAAQDGKEAA
jgi:glyceraldehyde 3-phosphate dehydrogenase